MGYSDDDARQSIRLSWGYDLSRDEIDHFIGVLGSIIG
jgi:cysteine sulfinate desulfinase/cysteine desulfurase-like protein